MAKKKPQQDSQTTQPCKPGERVECKYGSLEPVDKLRPNPQNPNKHSDDQVEKLAKLISQHGWRLPITVSNRSGFIVSGHGRLMAAHRLGLKTVPVDFQDFQNEAEELAVLISDNVIAELSEFDGLKMAELINELDVFDVNLEDFTALSADQILDYIHGPDKYGTEFSLPDGDKEPFQQMTFTLSDQQAEVIKEALTAAKHAEGYKELSDVYGNENSNGNALFLMVNQWAGQKI